MNFVNLLDPTQGIEDEAKALTEGDLLWQQFFISLRCWQLERSWPLKCFQNPGIAKNCPKLLPKQSSNVNSVSCHPYQLLARYDGQSLLLARIWAQTQFWLGHWPALWVHLSGQHSTVPCQSIFNYNETFDLTWSSTHQASTSTSTATSYSVLPLSSCSSSSSFSSSWSSKDREWISFKRKKP